MKKATRCFIKNRQPHSKYVVEPVNYIRKLGTGIPFECFRNSHNLRNRVEGIKMVSGWLIGPYDRTNDITPIIQHWWNADKYGFFDTTPNLSNDYDYVIDMDIYEGIYSMHENLISCVGHSLVFKSGFFYIYDDNSNEYGCIEKISLITKNLLKFDNI